MASGDRTRACVVSNAAVGSARHINWAQAVESYHKGEDGVLQDLVTMSRTDFFFFQAEDGIRDKLVTGVQTCALPISTIAFGFTPAAALSAARVSTKRLQRFANTSRNTATPSRVRSRRCTTSRLVVGEAACRVNHSTTQEQTSLKNAMVAPQGCTRSLTKSLFNPDGQDGPREHRFTRIRVWHRKQRTMTAVNGPKLRSKIVRWT